MDRTFKEMEESNKPLSTEGILNVNFMNAYRIN